MKIRYEFLTRSGGSYWWAGKDEFDEIVVCSVPVTHFWPEDQELDLDFFAQQAELLRKVAEKIKEIDEHRERGER